ncbi:hypothetical protein RB614_18815 [Phytohabitans sp. ZYX-F-186]|uniref:Uncharacterized protein n=1 Tax=Phytohabitans maris TaxID=3071409 RepID=A0ABU0ZHN6_9ACTN|nr:hypothetical protein [Phytohabitans sp. ZYX-F-186]MDQ7906571.1 hypothetical protein [Phytohabitans sp. ZYX-F-186]
MHPLIASMWITAYDRDLQDQARHARRAAVFAGSGSLRARAGHGLIRLGQRVAGEAARHPRPA